MKTRLIALIGAFTLILGGVAVALTSTSANATMSNAIDLHNATADSSEDCPDTGYAYWHFVLAPNNGDSAFVSITLNLGDETVTFNGFPPIIKNGSQTDNVFVQVPAGHSLTDLQTSGSYAIYSGETPTKFNLSHVCEGETPPSTTTTTTGESTTTTTTGQTTTTTTGKSTTTTVPAEVLVPAAVQTNPAFTG